MSSLVVCAQKALDGCFAFFPQKRSVALQHLTTSPKLAGITPASRLPERPMPQMASSGVREIDSLSGGLPRGCLTEVCGPASSGRTSVLLAALAAATQREEVCALVDASDAFGPPSAAAAGVDLGRLLWVRCDSLSPQRHSDKEFTIADCRLTIDPNACHHKSSIVKRKSGIFSTHAMEQALRAADLLLQSSGFGLVAIDLGDVPAQAARRIPLTSWFRFRRAVENTPTVLLVIGQEPCAQTCASLRLRLEGQKLSAFSSQLSASSPVVPAHAQLLNGIDIRVELLRSRLERKPVRSVAPTFVTKAAWTG